MKRIILSVAILAVAASCSKNEVVDIPQTNAIGFSTLNDRVTKAANDASADYRVFAVEDAATSAWLINASVAGVSQEDATVASTATTATDITGGTTGPYYWPAGTASFYAYAPYSATATNNVVETTATTDATNSVNIALTYTVPAGAQEDFTVAAPVTKAGTTSDPNVAFTFSHMLSMIEFQVVLDESTLGVNYEISTEYDNADDAPFTVSFSPTKETVTVDADVTAPAPTTVTPAEAISTKYAAYQSYYIAPQDLAGCKVQINGITIRHKTNGSALYDSVDFAEMTLTGNEISQKVGAEIVNKDAFENGKKYIFTVTISSSSTTTDDDSAIEIKFTAATTSWGDGTGVGLDQK
ncbi:MAG: fimbrillin family protein [Rikenellaceae bacterium]